MLPLSPIRHELTNLSSSDDEGPIVHKKTRPQFSTDDEEDAFDFKNPFDSSSDERETSKTRSVEKPVPHSSDGPKRMHVQDTRQNLNSGQREGRAEQVQPKTDQNGNLICQLPGSPQKASVAETTSIPENESTRADRKNAASPAVAHLGNIRQLDRPKTAKGAQKKDEPLMRKHDRDSIRSRASPKKKASFLRHQKLAKANRIKSWQTREENA